MTTAIARSHRTSMTLASQALVARDLILDALDVCFRAGEIPHSPITAAFEAWAQSWAGDRGEFLMALDFASKPNQAPQLVRTAAPWSLLGRAATASPQLKQSLGQWFVSRLGRQGTVSVRTGRHPERDQDDFAVARAIAGERIDVQMAALDAPWLAGEELAGAVFLDSYFGTLSCDYPMPPEDVRLAFPLWTVALDDPALLAVLYRFYPCHDALVEAIAGRRGRTLAQQISADITGTPEIWQDWAGQDPQFPITVTRVLVGARGVLGAVKISGANAVNPQTGTVSALGAPE